jgi:hypothetical protein
MVLYAYVLCLCILVSSRIHQYDLRRQTPAFSGGVSHMSIIQSHRWKPKRNNGSLQTCNEFDMNHAWTKSTCSEKVAKWRQNAKAKALRKCGVDQMNMDPALFIEAVKTAVKQGVTDQSAFCASHISRWNVDKMVKRPRRSRSNCSPGWMHETTVRLPRVNLH